MCYSPHGVMIKAGNITGDNTKITKIPMTHIAEYSIISLILITPFSPLPLLTNDLAQQPQWIKDSTGKITGYTTQEGGAGAVFPFSGTLVAQEIGKTIYGDSTYQIPQTITVDGITYKYVGIKSLTLNSSLKSGGGYTISVSETGLVYINTTAISAVLSGIALYSI